MKVCVIGAGPSGLTTIKQLLDEGHDVTCFDKNGNVGGIWYRHDADAEEMKAYDNLVLTVSMKLMSYSDFIYEGGRDFFTRKKYHAYLEQYADKFDLRRHIQLETSVTAVKKLAKDRWQVTTVSKNGETNDHTFGAVAVCSGPFQTPNREVTDLEKFTGEVVHSSAYRNNARFVGKRVLIVGLAESGADILTEVSNVAATCALSIRSYSFLLPRAFSGRHATDAGTSRAHHWEMYVRATKVPFTMPAVFGDRWYSRFAFWASSITYGSWNLWARIAKRAFGDKSETELPEKNPLGQPSLPLKLDVDTEWNAEHQEAIDEWNRRSHNYEGNWSPKVIFSKNVTFIPNLVSGKIKVHDKGIARIEGNRVDFKDGVVQEFDTIVLCTGFKKDFARFGDDLAVPENNVRNLYKHAFFPQHEGRLALMGYTRPFTGGIPICAEMQARYFALLCSDKRKLPADISERIRTDREWENHWSSLSPRATESIPSQVLYIDSIAREVGCLMPMWKLLLSPRMLVRMWYYPFNQAFYRLVGPHAMREKALAEMMAEKPGPLTTLLLQTLLMVMSFLPHKLHPKDIVGSRDPNMPRVPRPAGYVVHFPTAAKNEAADGPDSGVHANAMAPGDVEKRNRVA